MIKSRLYKYLKYVKFINYNKSIFSIEDYLKNPYVIEGNELKANM